MSHLGLTMTLKHICLLILAVAACVAAQTDDEFNIPVENDNQFPPDDHSETAIIEGSGLGAIEEPIDVTTQPNAPLIDDSQLPIVADDEVITEGTSCPKPCVCHIDGGASDYVVDCSGYGLAELPSPIDERTTILNIQNNKLTEIPKKISSLKNLKVLNANDNSIMDLASGSISELLQLTSLKLANNRLIEFPKDLKNSFGLTNLNELDLGGNDMRTPLTSEVFTNFVALNKLTLPEGAKELQNSLCSSISLDTVCSGNICIECPNAKLPIDEDMLDVALPGTIALGPENENDDVSKNIINDFENIETPVKARSESFLENIETTPASVEPQDEISNKNIETTLANVEQLGEKPTASSVDFNENVTAEPGLFSMRSAVNNAEPASISPLSALVETPKATEDDHKESDVKVGATTSNSNSGGVDKSVIGLIVAGMVLVVAGITIKKNWSSIRNKFSSTPRAANDRTTATTNGTAPEEVPLQDKSPV